MTYYTSNNNYSDIDVYNSLINTIKCLKYKIHNYIQQFIQNTNESLLNKQSLDYLISEIKELFVNLEDILSKMEIYEEEYYDFSLIKDMVFYILEDESSFGQINQINSLLATFYDSILLKSNISNEEYNKKYEKFSMELIDYAQFFYTEIAKPSKYYNEEILSKITNSLLNL